MSFLFGLRLPCWSSFGFYFLKNQRSRRDRSSWTSGFIQRPLGWEFGSIYGFQGALLWDIDRKPDPTDASKVDAAALFLTKAGSIMLFNGTVYFNLLGLSK
jgi:hypothetical protein